MQLVTDVEQHCGAELYADFPNNDPDAVVRLSEELNRPTYSAPVHAPSGNASQGSAPSLTRPTVAHLAGSPQGHSTFGRNDGNRNDSALLLGSGPNAQQQTATVQTPVPKYFELCVNTGSYCQTLSEIDVTRVAGDAELFRWIRRRYKDLRGWRTKARFCLRPKSMRFVYFGLEHKRKVHILCDTESFPPESDVTDEKYHYAPCPPKPLGAAPMPSNVFIHYLHFCNLDGDPTPWQRTWFDRLPKKIKDPVLDNHVSQASSRLVEAFGVHIHEGVDSAAVLWTVIITLVICLGPLLAAYIAMTGDVQSATGIASLVVAVIAALWMCMQIEVGKNT